MKKVFSFILAICLIFSLIIPAFAEEKKPLNYVVLGDSIAEGYGVVNSYSACYGRIVAETNGYDYENFGRAAKDSYDLLAEMTDCAEIDRHYANYRNYIDNYMGKPWPDSESEEYQEHIDAYRAYSKYFTVKNRCDVIKNADIISISIGANDYLCHPNVYGLAIGAFFMVNGITLNKIADKFYDNLCGIIGAIRQVNPTATILLQKVYTIWYGPAATIFGACTKRVNKMIDKFDKEHPDEVNICDITPAMNKHPENLADDCVHPNAAGNVAIAKIVLAQLKELGLGENTEPVVNYEGIDYNYYEYVFEKESTVKFMTGLIKFLTGNWSIIGR